MDIDEKIADVEKALKSLKKQKHLRDLLKALDGGYLYARWCPSEVNKEVYRYTINGATFDDKEFTEDLRAFVRNWVIKSLRET